MIATAPQRGQPSGPWIMPLDELTARVIVPVGAQAALLVPDVDDGSDIGRFRGEETDGPAAGTWPTRQYTEKGVTGEET
jgi:hypothetical protein